MKKIIYISIVLTLIGFVPIIHQEISSCSAFGFSHLASPAVITTADSCSTSIFASTLTLGVQLSRIFHFNSVYLNYFLLAFLNFIFYIILGKLIIIVNKKIKKL